MNTLMSPFSVALASCSSELPSAFSEQYLLPANANYRVVLTGRMEKIWHRPRWIWPFLWLMAQADIIFPETGENVPARLTIHSLRDENGLPLHEWQRSFSLNPPRQFNATMAYSPLYQKVIERLGPGRLLQITWHVQFFPPNRLEITSNQYMLVIGKFQFRIPSPLMAKVRAIQWADLSNDNMIRIELEISMPLIGPAFGYEGTFVLHREAETDPLV